MSLELGNQSYVLEAVTQWSEKLLCQEMDLNGVVGLVDQSIC